MLKHYEKELEAVRFVSILFLLTCFYLSWLGIDVISAKLLGNLIKVIPWGFLVLFLSTVPLFVKRDWFITGYIAILLAVPAFFYYQKPLYLRFYWHIPLVLAMIFLTGKFSFSKIYSQMLLYFSVGYTFMASLKYLLVVFEIGNLALWINKNIIAGTVFFAVMTAIILLDQLNEPNSWLYQIGLSILAMLIFILADSWTPIISFVCFWTIPLMIRYFSKIQLLLEKRSFWLTLFSATFVLVPIFMYIFAANNGFGFRLSGRTGIWQEFFEVWGRDQQTLWIGLKDYFKAPSSNLATHNAFLDVLGSYGIVGYVIMFSGILFLMFWRTPKKYSYNQILCLIAFFACCIHALMENYMNSFEWIGIIFIFSGMFISRGNEVQESEREAETSFEDIQIEFE